VNFELVTLTAVAMMLGLPLSSRRRDLICTILEKSGHRGGVVEQMKIALQEYQDGWLWDFDEGFGAHKTGEKGFAIESTRDVWQSGCLAKTATKPIRTEDLVDAPISRHAHPIRCDKSSRHTGHRYPESNKDSKRRRDVIKPKMCPFESCNYEIDWLCRNAYEDHLDNEHSAILVNDIIGHTKVNSIYNGDSQTPPRSG
jgi:hypothetical protein